MRLLLSCDNCKATSVVSCSGCPPEGHLGPPEGHLDICPFKDLGAALSCRPGSGCCPEDHSHDGAANACPGAGTGHPGAACPAAAADCIAVTPRGEPCPGGHCARGVPGCTVCRPITVTVLDLDIPAGQGA
jgi:hypothetical protein